MALLVLHFFIKDSSFESSLWFYVFPLPVIIVVILCLSVFAFNFRKYNLKLASVLMLLWLGRSFRVNFFSEEKDSDLEVVFWNASRENDFNNAIDINGGVPDVLVLTESIDLDFEELKETYFYKAKRELRVFSKFPIIIKQDTTSNFKTSIVNFETASVNFYAVDVSGSTDVPRFWEIGFLDKIIKKEENTVVLGDFNVPYESILLKQIKENYVHFFSRKGNGFRETWFLGMPLLSLDQIWVSRDLEIIKSEKVSTSKSDHSMIKTIIRK
ncbi:endonuclease/exonuclease/phosphatase family protein [uncultured Algibacter sp.]|uniref:endonuclease/exonuclease/phosphatase family protein n=1 Tax=uncultured Algibacter sp. TaxID=298659 RepID=UPI00261028DE|nr:endonuclease/exonuclease/phosphatase family protein [uncultured Algibacter sp.]